MPSVLLKIVTLVAALALLYFGLLEVVRHRYKKFLPLKITVLLSTIIALAFGIYLLTVIWCAGAVFLLLSSAIWIIGRRALRETLREAAWDSNYDPSSSGIVKATAAATSATLTVIGAAVKLLP